MTADAELQLQITRYRQLSTPLIIDIIRTAADNGYPTATSGAGQGSSVCTCGNDPDSPDPANCPHGTATERNALHQDPTAQRAQQLLDTINRINRGRFAQTEMATLLRYAADQLEEYDPARNTTIECVHCRQRRDRTIDDCPNCGIPADAWRCTNPHHNGYTTGPARNGMCNPCYRYNRRTGNNRPPELIHREALAQRTSDTETVNCINPNCNTTTPWRQLRDGRCQPCAGHWNSLGRERIPTAALNLDTNVIIDEAS